MTKKMEKLIEEVLERKGPVKTGRQLASFISSICPIDKKQAGDVIKIIQELCEYDIFSEEFTFKKEKNK